MASVSRAFYETPRRRGLVIGVIPGQVGSALPKPGYPNRWVEIPIFTHLPLSGTEGREPLSRNHINVLSADVIIALPGGAGTASEVSLALSYRRPVIGYLDSRDQIPSLPAEVPMRSSLDEVKEFVRSSVPFWK